MGRLKKGYNMLNIGKIGKKSGFCILEKVLIITLVLMLGVPFYLFAQNKSDSSSKNKKDNYLSEETSFYKHAYSGQKKNIFISFGDWLNSTAYAASVIQLNAKKQIRQEWKDFFGVDVFLPYFEYKQAEEKVREKTSVKVFKLKGCAEISADKIEYTFRIKF